MLKGNKIFTYTMYTYTVRYISQFIKDKEVLNLNSQDF